jgi:hypothetical protein
MGSAGPDADNAIVGIRALVSYVDVGVTDYVGSRRIPKSDVVLTSGFIVESAGPDRRVAAPRGVVCQGVTPAGPS